MFGFFALETGRAAAAAELTAPAAETVGVFLRADQ